MRSTISIRPSAIASTLVGLQADGLGIDYIQRRVDLINDVTLDEVQAAARKLLSAEPAMHGGRAAARGWRQGVKTRRCGAAQSGLGPSFAVAFGGGGARGLAHIHVIEALDELGIRPMAIAGSSIGAIMGAGMAAGMTGTRHPRLCALGAEPARRGGEPHVAGAARQHRRDGARAASASASSTSSAS